MRARVVGALVAAACVLAGCGAPSQVTGPAEPPPLHRAGPPLPSGAVLEPAAAREPQPLPKGEIVGSIAPGDATPQQRIPEVAQRGRIIVGVDQSQYLLSFRDSNTGELDGFEVGIAREIARDIFGDPNAVDFRFVDSSDRAKALNSGRVDIVIRTMSITPARQNVVAFSTPYLDAQLRMLVPRGSRVHDFESLGHGTLCVADGATAVDTARAYAPEANLLITSKWSDCLLALQQFQAHAVLADDSILSGMAAQDPSTEMVDLSLHEQSYGVGMRRDDEGMVRQVNSTLERIMSDGTWGELYDEWFAPYLGPHAPPPLHYREENVREENVEEETNGAG